MTPGDFGPIYAETDLSRFPVEPFNTYSNLIFLFIFIYFAARSRLRYREQPLLVISLPILLIGFIGGTVFHATRSHNIWLFLDFMPILVLTVMTGVYYWARILGGIVRAALVAVPLFVLMRFLRTLLPFERQLHISLGYSTAAISILLPCVIFSLKNSRVGLPSLLFAAFSFIFAVMFRILDKDLGLPMGSHFLWHLCGGISVFWMFRFVEDTAKPASAVTPT